MLNMLREKVGGKISMARVACASLIPAVYVALFLGRDWQTVTAIVSGGIVSLAQRKKTPAQENGTHTA